MSRVSLAFVAVFGLQACANEIPDSEGSATERTEASSSQSDVTSGELESESVTDTSTGSSTELCESFATQGDCDGVPLSSGAGACRWLEVTTVAASTDPGGMGCMSEASEFRCLPLISVSEEECLTWTRQPCGGEGAEDDRTSWIVPINGGGTALVVTTEGCAGPPPGYGDWYHCAVETPDEMFSLLTCSCVCELPAFE